MEDSRVCKGYYGKFKEQGLRMTLPRQVILDILNENDFYMSAEEVYHSVHSDYPQIGLATVYRTLNLFADMGIVTKFEFGEGKARYELSERGIEEKHHHLLICSCCYRVIKYHEFSDEERKLYAETEKSLEKTYDFEIQRHVVEYYGLCAECRKFKNN